MNEYHSNTADSIVSDVPQRFNARNRLIDLTGKKFGRMKVLSRDTTRKGVFWNCVCDCGNSRSVVSQNLRDGITKSCGCLMLEVCKRHRVTHGLNSNGKTHPVYETYKGMIRRCRNKKRNDWHLYGGRGIKVCDRWKDPVKFIEDMLPSWKPGLTIERIDVNGNYDPGNCRWATVKEQARNKRNNRIITIGEKSKCISEWAEFMNIPNSRIEARIKRGWSESEAVLGKT